MNIPAVYPKPAGTLRAILPRVPIENAVFEVGGPRRLLYIGAIRVLDGQAVIAGVHKIGGSSAGVMTAHTVRLGFNARQTQQTAEAQRIGDHLTDISADDQASFPAKAIQALRSISGTSQMRRQGVFRREKLYALIAALKDRRVIEAKALIEPQGLEAIAFWPAFATKKGAITFAEFVRLGEMTPELRIRNRAFTGTHYTDQQVEVFSLADTPDMPPALAVRISASLPWFFKTEKYNGKEYKDGDCLEIFPIWIFDAPTCRAAGLHKIRRGVSGQNLATLGFKVNTINEIRTILWEAAQADKRSDFAGTWDDFKTWIEANAIGVDAITVSAARDKAVYGKYAQRAVQGPDLDYSTFQFNKSDDNKARRRLLARARHRNGFCCVSAMSGSKLKRPDDPRLRMICRSKTSGPNVPTIRNSLNLL